jgi:transposase-like protein
MAGTRYSEEIRRQVLRLGALGNTYAQIQKKYPVPKSTLSFWFSRAGKKQDRTRQLAHLRLARIASAKTKGRQKAARLKEAWDIARRIAARVPIHEESFGKSLLAMLYWGEGGKTDGNMKFTNTDPELVSLFASLLRAHYSIDEARFRVGLQIHNYHDPKKTLNFWSRKLSIPTSQFWKIYLKPRSGKKKEYRRNFYGICNLHYASSAVQRELISLGKEISLRIAHNGHFREKNLR